MIERTLTKIKAAGKWFEYWFSDPPSEKWEQCSKTYMLWELVEKVPGLDEHILNHGFVGLIVGWEAGSDRPCSIRKREGPVALKARAS